MFVKLKLTITRLGVSALQCVEDVLEHTVDLAADSGEHNDHDDGDQEDDQRIFDQALTLFTLL